MNVIALLSHPQEYGDGSLRLVNCADGQVVLDINLTPQEELYEKVDEITLLSDKEIFYDHCAKQRFDIYDREDYIPSILHVYADKEGTKPLDRNLNDFWTKYQDDDLTILDVEDLGVIPYKNEFEKQFLKGIEIHAWKYTVAKAKVSTDYVYHPEWDTVYKEILEKVGIKCPSKERHDEEALAHRISEALGYNLLNVLWG